MPTMREVITGVIESIAKETPSDRAEAEALLAHLETFRPPSAATPTYARRPTGRKAAKKGGCK